MKIIFEPIIDREMQIGWRAETFDNRQKVIIEIRLSVGQNLSESFVMCASMMSTWLREHRV